MQVSTYIIMRRHKTLDRIGFKLPIDVVHIIIATNYNKDMDSIMINIMMALNQVCGYRIVVVDRRRQTRRRIRKKDNV